MISISARKQAKNLLGCICCSPPHEAGAIPATLTVHLCRLWHTGEECVAQGLLAPQRGPQCSGPRSTTSRLLTGLQDAFLLFPALE